MSLRIDISDKATPVLHKIHATLADRADFNENLGARVEQMCKDYVQQDTEGRHKSANALGAAPTGFLGGAVEGIVSKSDAYGATVEFHHLWFARVGQDVDIAAADYGHKVFTIPVDAESYGHRIMIGVDKPRFPGGFWKPSADKKCAIYCVPDGKGGLRVLYIGVPKVHQPQDRTRLPGDDVIMETVTDEMKVQLKERLAALNSIAP
jgi:hypothetical protein